MDSVGAGAARGLQAGWQMGMQADQAARQREQDALNRAQQDRVFGLQQDAATRAEQRLQHETERQDAADQYKLLTDQLKDITTQSASLQQAGQGVPPELATRYQDVTGALRTHRERAMAPLLAAKKQDDDRYWAGVQAGQIDPTTTPSGEFYSRFSRAIGMTPAGLAKAAQGAQLVQQGFDAGNQQLMLQGVNQLVERDLRAGEGGPSPHGGVITRKEVVGLLPVKDANGVEHPDKVFPIIRTYVMHPEGGGQEDYYDAPLTQNRTGDPNDPVQALDLNHAFDYMGRVGAMAQLLQHPDLQRKLAEGEQETGAQTQRDVETINALGRAHLAEAAKGAVAQRVQAILTSMPPGEERDKAIRIALGTEAPVKAPAAGVQRDEARVERIKQMRADNLIDDAQMTLMLKAITTGVHDSRVVGLEPPPKAAAKGAKAAGMGTGGGGGAAGGYADVLKKATPGERLMAGEWLATGKNPGVRKGSELLRLSEIRAAMMGNAGLTLKDVVQQGDTMKLTAGAASELEKMHAAVESFSSTAKANMKVLEELSSKLPRSDIPIISKGQLAIDSFTGNPVLTQYQGAMASVTAEVSRILNQPRLVGQLTDSARRETQEFLHGKMTHSQLVELFKTLRTEMANREQGIVDMKNVLATRRTGMAGKLSGDVAAGMGIQPVAPMTGSGAPGAPTKPLPPGVKFLGFE